jgi:iron(III) transport system permease protein
MRLSPAGAARAAALAVLLVLFLAPLGSLLIQAVSPADGVFEHLWHTVLGRYALGTLGLFLLVLPGVALVGTVSAWLVTMCSFPLRRLFEWALLLPFAAPAYVLAYVYTDALAESVPGIRSLPGAAALFILTLYPYVFLLARASFLQQSVCVLEAARTLGSSPGEAFRRVALPLARPSIAAGCAMALMEVAADFGTVEYFAVDTFSTGVFRAWFGLGSKAGAAQLSLALLALVGLLLWLERTSRRQRRFFQTSSRYRALAPFRLTGFKAALAVLTCAVPVAGAFLIPGGLLALNFLRGGLAHVHTDFFAMAARSLTLALGAAVLCCTLGLLLAWAARRSRSHLTRLAINVASLSYALPGAVLAVGILFPLAAVDGLVADTVLRLSGHDPGLWLSGTVVALLYAYTVRFGAVPLQGLQAAFTRVTPSMEHSSRLLGRSSLGTLRAVFLPLVRGSYLAALVIVLVDVAKELPATLVLRPFDFDTLATHTYRLASDERLTEASPAALAIVLLGMLPVYLLSRGIRASRPGAGPQEIVT